MVLIFIGEINMQGKILNFRRGKKTQHTDHILIEINDEKYRTKESVAPLFGKKVVYKTVGNKMISGKIVAAHGNKGVIRAIFEKSLPGESIGQSVEIK
jgi:large subunit ribosomal protein L35Ae